ncbi:MAG: hypothetical protein COV07_00480 [Candidatus Vogelbacteria bacterium CG10_big_fil_rev_8_21_14_0_10_45_14]|uniref:Transposase IS200-like domain-containing protein n=1 Tax=Candidatus Vogelbacteria bacterium CG10_big_fil_rev_8_21_14_0_10_45_14 TaxID=1975042 RepID=A0A2H0RL33_9BACT|nr:MAG: hypothetical protein COV07_00480 [Candidatus Vogelbacteria bacterium CG10_big_fil_rev_8_21_14_0_10_45_14]
MCGIIKDMARAPRIDLAGYVYHVINRANEKRALFNTDKDYFAFEEILREGIALFDMQVFVFEIMPNHWHLVVSPKNDGDMGLFMAWLTTTHATRFRKFYDSVGFGHVYQGRYKSFIVQTDAYFYRVCRYVERNALRAGLATKAQEWKWGSAWIRKYGNEKQRKMLAEWPLKMPSDYDKSLNENDESDGEKKTLQEIRNAVNRGCPYGSDLWKEKITERFHIESTTRKPGRPSKQ